MKIIINRLCEVVPYFAACVIWAGALIMDVIVLKTNCAENGVVETCQLLAVSSSGILMMLAAAKNPERRAGFVLAGAFFLTMAIRETDQVLDRIWHGFWLVPALAMVLAAVCYAIRHRKTVVPGLRAIAADGESSALAIGVLTILGFSRVMGHKIFWKMLVGGGLFCAQKRFVEESCELFGYLVVLAWTIAFFLRMANRRISV